MGGANFFAGKPVLGVGVVQADGARSPPIVLPVRSELASMEIVTEPSLQDPTLLAMGLDHGAPLPNNESGWYWPVRQPESTSQCDGGPLTASLSPATSRWSSLSTQTVGSVSIWTLRLIQVSSASMNSVLLVSA